MSDDDDDLICPITQELFRDPVIAEDGHWYEREAITRWIIQNRTSPLTRQDLNVNNLQSDEEVRRRADQRRRLSVTYNRESDQVKLPPIQSPRNIHSVNRTTDIEYPREPINLYTRCQDILRACRNMHISRDRCCESGDRTSSSCLWRHRRIILCICVTIFILILPVVTLSLYLTSRNEQPTHTSMSYILRSRACYALNHTLTTNSCLTFFTNITHLNSGTCNSFTYQYMAYEFTASSSVTTIVFAFQQTLGYWDIDNITLWDSNINQYIFRNGDFESGILSPDYSRCQSVGYISNSGQLNGLYCYSDRTNGQFGYLMQNVSTTVGSWYYLEFYLQNRNGSGSSYMVFLGT